MFKNKFSKFLFLCTTLFTSFLLSNEVFAKSPLINRLSGINRYETNISIVKNGWSESSNVVLANGQDYPDALCAAPLANVKNAPIILTSKDHINTSAINELSRLKTKNVYIIGGTGVVSSKIEEKLERLGINCIRLAGKNRYETSVRIAEQIGTSNGIVVASGENFPDALSIAPIAAKKNMPILLSPKNSLPQEVNSYLQGKNITNSYIVGGVGVISTDIRNSLKNVKRLSGMNRYETNIKVLREFQNSLDLTSMYAASGKNFPDALSGSTLAAKHNAPLVLMDTNLSEATSDYLKTQNTKTLNVFGGTGAVSSNVENTLKSTMKYLNITKVDNISDLCFIGDTNYTFPTTALATFEDSSRKLVPVKWNSTAVDTSKAGSYNFEGTVQGYTGKVQMTLKITEEKGNINGNLVNGGKFAYYKGKLYFADVKNNNNIYRMDNYGTNLTKLNSDDSSHINIVKNHIYYHNMSDDGKIYKMNLDGSAKIKLIDQSTSEFIVVGDWIYYSYNNNGSNFYKMKTDGSNNIKLNDDNASCINIINNYIYYSNKNDNNSIYKMKIDGSEKTKVCSDTSFFVNVVDDWIYYFKPEDIDYHLYKIKTNGTEKTQLPVEVGHSLNVYDGWIYYISPLDDIRLCKMRIDGSDKTILSDYIGKSVHIIGDLIFYYNEEYKTYFTMKLDGSMDWIFKNTVINENESNNTLSSANKINLPIGLSNAIDITGNIKKGDVDYYKISIPKDSYNTNYFNVILNSPNIGSNSTVSLLDQYGNIIHSVQSNYKGIGFFSLEIPPGQSSTCYLKISSPHGDLIETGEYTLMTYIVNK